VFGRDILVGFVVTHAESPMRRADYRTTQAWLEIADFIAPSDARVAFLNARLHRHVGNQEMFVDWLKKAQTRGFPRSRIALEQTLHRTMTGNMKVIDQQLSSLLIDGTDAYEICEAYVLGCLMAYRLADAEAVLQVWLSDFPDGPKARFLYGRLLEHRENLDSAAEQYTIASKLNHGPSAYALAGVLAEQHDFESAIVQATRARDLLYDAQPGNVMLARLHRMVGTLDSAPEYLSQATESDPDTAAIAWKVAGVPACDSISAVDSECGEIQLARKNYAEAESSFRLALKKSPQRWRLRNSLATALRLQGKLNEASEQLTRFRVATQALDECGSLIDQLRAAPDNVEARFQVAMTLLEHVSEDQGLVWLRSVLQYDPSHQEANRILFEYYRDHASMNSSFSRLSKHHEQQLNGE
jgi:tetratricopeptide (TPR) repeat protein